MASQGRVGGLPVRRDEAHERRAMRMLERVRVGMGGTGVGRRRCGALDTIWVIGSGGALGVPVLDRLYGPRDRHKKVLTKTRHL